MRAFILTGAAVVGLLLTTLGCKNMQKKVENFNLYSVDQDMALGRKVAQEIAGNPKEFPILPEAGNEKAYAYLRGIAQKLLKTGYVEYASKFKWEIKIIKDDKTLNAFCTPGGYIYVYTGLIQFLDTEDQLAGVMGHEMGHAAKRHSTRQLTKMYGVTALTELLASAAGDKYGETSQTLKDVTNALVGLKFSREHEEEADVASVKYLCGTPYKASGAAGFFEKIKTAPQPPAFLSTHPNPADREAKIKALASGCKGKETYQTEYQKFKSLLK